MFTTRLSALLLAPSSAAYRPIDDRSWQPLIGSSNTLHQVRFCTLVTAPANEEIQELHINNREQVAAETVATARIAAGAQCGTDLRRPGQTCELQSDAQPNLPIGILFNGHLRRHMYPPKVPLPGRSGPLSLSPRESAPERHLDRPIRNRGRGQRVDRPRYVRHQ